MENNPFAALFSSADKAQEFSTLHKSPTLQTGKELDPLKPPEKRLASKAELEVNNILENVFLITFNKDPGGSSRPTRLLYLEELSLSHEKTWLDRDTFEQTVFERLMLESPGNYVINTSTTSTTNPQSASEAGESEHLRYLYRSYTRSQEVSSSRKNQYSDLIEQCQKVILSNARMCLQHPDFFLNLDSGQQMYSIFTDEDSSMFDFFERVAADVHANSDEGSILDAFRPLLDQMQQKLEKEGSLGHSAVIKCAGLLQFFTKAPYLAEAFVTYTSPKVKTSGRQYESTLLGLLLSVSCLAKSDAGPYEFFENASRYSKQEHDITEASIHGPTALLNESLYQLIYGILRLGGNPRSMMLSWLGDCLSANMGRAKMWSSQMPALFGSIHASDGFFVNLSSVLLRLCQPFSEPRSPKLLRIQESYCLATGADDIQRKAKNVHMKGLHDQTTLAPAATEGEDARPDVPLETSYNFITECFFMTHQCLYLGLHVVNEKFLKLNQELQRIQGLYQDLERQGAQQSEAAGHVKDRVDKGMTVFLSLKAVLTEPRLMDLCFDFYTATATYLSHVGVSPDTQTSSDTPAKFADVTFPLPTETPTCLTRLPEMLMENIIDFMLFVRRFKDPMYESQGPRLTYLMTLILVYMGSPNRMRNPHFRARLAEALEALMPRKASQGPTLITNYHREQLFVTHPLCEHISQTLLHVFVSIEMTGQSVEFEHKFNYRRPMYAVLEYLIGVSLHQHALQDLASYAEEHIEDVDPPLFLRFINLLINDAIFLLDEALSYMSQIREKQAEQDSGAWTELSATQRQENEQNLRYLGMLARFHNIMGCSTIHSLELLTQHIRSIFTHKVIVDRIAAMLNYFLLHLVGPKKKTLRVKDLDEYDFRPQDLVSDISQIYVNLGEDEDGFCQAVSADGRSYSPDLFAQAEAVLRRIHREPSFILRFMEVGAKIRVFAARQTAENEAIESAPEEFLDPIMGTLMRDPVLLPSSGQTVDRATIARHILSDQSDPFNRSPLTMDMVKVNEELKERIDKWLADLHVIGGS